MNCAKMLHYIKLRDITMCNSVSSAFQAIETENVTAWKVCNVVALKWQIIVERKPRVQ